MGRARRRVKTVVRDGMKIEADVPIPMDNGVVLKADIYRPIDDKRYPVILSYGAYAKGIAFQVAYAAQWHKIIAEHPDVVQAKQTTIRTGKWSIRRSESRMATSVSGSTRAGQANRPVSLGSTLSGGDSAPKLLPVDEPSAD
jgi:hypothetical protein